MANYMTEFSPDNDSHVYQVKDSEATPISLLEDTVGWVGKNLLINHLTSGSQSGVTYTVNADGSISLSGTASADIYLAVHSRLIENELEQGDYILSGCPSGGGEQTYQLFYNDYTAGTYSNDYGNGKRFTRNTNNPYNITIKINSGQNMSGKTFYPMLRKANIVDPTFEPYHKSVEDWYWENNPNAGAKNILPITLAKLKELNTGGTWSDNVYTWKNVAFTVNTDSKGNVTSITTSNVSNAQANFTLGDFNIPAGSYIGNGAPVMSSNWWAWIDYRNHTQSVDHNDQGSGVAISANANDNIKANIFIGANKDASGITFYPMIRDARDTNPDFEPYAMTNRELTEKVMSGWQTITKNGLTIQCARFGRLATISFTNGTVEEAIDANGSIVRLFDFDKLFTSSELFAISSEVLETYGRTLRIWATENEYNIRARSAVNAGTIIRGTIIGFVRDATKV